MNTMKRSSNLHMTDDIVEALTQANMAHASEEHRKIFREALRALVRLAKAEKLLEMRRDTATALGIHCKGPDSA